MAFTKWPPCICITPSQRDRKSSSLIFIFRGHFISSLFYKRHSPWWSQKDMFHTLCSISSGEKAWVVLVPDTKRIFFWRHCHSVWSCHFLEGPSPVLLPFLTGCLRLNSLPEEMIGKLLSIWYLIRWPTLSNTWSLVLTWERKHKYIQVEC